MVGNEGTLLTWPGRLWRYRAGRVFAVLIVLGFLGLQAQDAVRAGLPVPASLKKGWPWAMFKSYSRWDRVHYAYGQTDDGEWEEIPLHELFGYMRGATNLLFYDHATAMRGGKRYKNQRLEYAEWLAQKMFDEKGRRYKQVRLRRRGRNVDTNEIKVDKIGTFKIFWKGDRVVPRQKRRRPKPLWSRS